MPLTIHSFTTYTQKNSTTESLSRRKSFVYTWQKILHGTSLVQYHSSFHMVTSNKGKPKETPCSTAGPDTLISNHRQCQGTELILSSHKAMFKSKSPPDLYIRKTENFNQNHTSLETKWFQIFKSRAKQNCNACFQELRCQIRLLNFTYKCLI